MIPKIVGRKCRIYFKTLKALDYRFALVSDDTREVSLELSRFRGNDTRGNFG